VRFRRRAAGNIAVTFSYCSLETMGPISGCPSRPDQGFGLRRQQAEILADRRLQSSGRRSRLTHSRRSSQRIGHGAVEIGIGKKILWFLPPSSAPPA
jgi:hypothetical protein